MVAVPPELRRTWLFGPGAEPAVHRAMLDSGADALILDLEDFTPPDRRPEAHGLLAAYVKGCRARGLVAAIRINQLDAGGDADLAAAMACRPDVIALPMCETVPQLQAVDAAIGIWEARLGLPAGATELLPVCETALGVVDVRQFAVASPRVTGALLGAEDLASDLRAERGADALELDHARRRFVLECRAAKIEPIDAPYTFADADGAMRETLYARRLGYLSKALVRPDHAQPINNALTPQAGDVARAAAIVDGFTAARARGEDRVLVEGLWVEVPTFRNAQRLLARAHRLASRTGR